MNIVVYGFLALLPIIVVAVFLVGLKWPASRAMPISYVTVLIIALFVWKLPVMEIVGGTVKGLITAITLLYIIFGSILVLNTIMESGGLHQIRQSLTNITKDRRIQVIIVAWLFGSFIEGSSGFGTPAAVSCPLMLGLGFPAFAAVISGMIIQSTPVTFGAVATPVRTGIGGGLGGGLSDGSPVHLYSQRLASEGLIGGDVLIESTNAEGVVSMVQNPVFFDQFLGYISHYAALLHFVGGFCLPLLLVAFLTKGFGEKKSYSEGLAVWPFCFFGALAFTIPYLLINFYLNWELTSMLGALTGLVIVIFAAQAGFLMPKKTWDFLAEEKWDPGCKGTITIEYVEKPGGMSTIMAWMPYVCVVALILITRLVPSFKAFLNNNRIGPINVPYTLPDGVTVANVATTWEILYSPGTIFIVVACITFFLHGMKGDAFGRAWKKSALTMVDASTALIFTVPMVQVFINSAGGFDPTILALIEGAHPDFTAAQQANYTAMPYVLAEAAYALGGSIWPFIAPIVGGLGAFVAGSNTVSNMTFSLFQFTTANLIVAGTEGLPGTVMGDIHWPAAIVGLQALGGAAGNVICVHNVVAAAAVVGFMGKEGIVIRRTFLVFCYYCLIPSAAGTIFLYSTLKSGMFFAGIVILAAWYLFVIYLLATNKSRLKQIGSSLAD
ncbi:MAG: L-lactate permease [Gracilibacteraceae bacterium]|jgi:lactate permease|nr:L-lactate permease [Gracilibacteraceae bacterium]